MPLPALRHGKDAEMDEQAKPQPLKAGNAFPLCLRVPPISLRVPSSRNVFFRACSVGKIEAIRTRHWTASSARANFPIVPGSL